MEFREKNKTKLLGFPNMETGETIAEEWLFLEISERVPEGFSVQNAAPTGNQKRGREAGLEGIPRKRMLESKHARLRNSLYHTGQDFLRIKLVGVFLPTGKDRGQ